MDRVAMRGGDFGQVNFEVQTEKFSQLFSVLVGRRTVVAMIDPKHRDVRRNLRAQMQKDGFVRAEVR